MLKIYQIKIYGDVDIYDILGGGSGPNGNREVYPFNIVPGQGFLQRMNSTFWTNYKVVLQSQSKKDKKLTDILTLTASIKDEQINLSWENVRFNKIFFNIVTFVAGYS